MVSKNADLKEVSDDIQNNSSNDNSIKLTQITMPY